MGQRKSCLSRCNAPRLQIQHTFTTRLPNLALGNGAPAFTDESPPATLTGSPLRLLGGWPGANWRLVPQNVACCLSPLGTRAVSEMSALSEAAWYPSPQTFPFTR